MAYSVNKITLLGTLGRDAETKFTSGGNAVTKFSIATEHSYKQGDEWNRVSTWHNIVLWGAEKLASYLTKGSKVYLEGRLENRSYEDKDGNKKYVTEVIADSQSIVLCGTKPVQEDSNGYASQPRSSRQSHNSDFDDEPPPF